MLVFVAPAGYPNKYNPLLGIFIYKRYKEIAKHGAKIVVLDASAYKLRDWLKHECSNIKETNDDVGTVYELHSRGFMTSRFPRIAVHTYKKKLEKLYDEAVRKHGKPDILIAHFSLPCGFAALEFAKRKKLPVVIVEHHHIMCAKKLHSYIQKNLKITVTNADAFICASEYLKNMIEIHTGVPNKIEVINNHIDDRFTYCLPHKNDNFIFFSAGNLKSTKRFDLLIKAFCSAFNSTELVRLRIAGAGEEYDKLLKMIKDNNRSHQIHLLNQLDSDEMLKEYRQCHCFALASEVETFGNVYREALAVGRPVISTKNGGIQENWEDSFGILTKVNDVDAFAVAMKKMIDNYNSYDGLYISKTCIETYGIFNTVGSFEKILSRCIKHFNDSK